MYIDMIIGVFGCMASRVLIFLDENSSRLAWPWYDDAIY